LLVLITGCQHPSEWMRASAAKKRKGAAKLPADFTQLYSVCRKAMAAEPGRRYRSVTELREDVENFLSDRRVNAHDESIGERVSRLSRKHRSIVNTVLAASAVIAVLSSLAAFWIGFERNLAIVAQKSEEALRFKAQQAQAKETNARKYAELRTAELTQLASVFADLFAGPDDAGLRVDMRSLSLQQGLDELYSRMEEYDSPVIQAFILAVMARNRKGASKYQESLNYYRQSLQSLKSGGINEVDPLYVDILVGLCAAQLASGATQAAETTAQQALALCDQSPVHLETYRFRTLMYQMQIALRKNQRLASIDYALQAISLAEKIYKETPSHANLLWAQYMLANAYRRIDDAKAIEIFRQVNDQFKQIGAKGPLAIAAAVQLAEMSLANSPDEAVAIMDSAIENSKQVYGETHADHIEILAWQGKLYADHPAADVQNRGIALLEDCRKLQAAMSGLGDYETISTSYLLAAALLKQKDEKSAQRVINVIRETLDAVELLPESDRPLPLMMVSLLNQIAVAHEKLGEFEKALSFISQAINLAQGFDSTSSQSQGLKQLKFQLEDRLRSTKTDAN
jgi:tetratricopeptide (TPR) repeat protein